MNEHHMRIGTIAGSASGLATAFRPALFASALLIGACTTPDVGAGIGEAASLLAETDQALRPTLNPLAATELVAAEEAAMASGKTIVELQGDCDYTLSRGSGQILTDCGLRENARPMTGPVNATQVIEALDILDDYFTALSKLASSESSDEVAARTAGLMDALASLGDGDGTGLDKLAKAATEQKPLVVKALGFVAAQVRVAGLRRVVRKADPLIGELTEAAVAWLDDLPGGMPAAQERLTGAEEAVTLAALAGDVGRQRAAAAELRAALAAFKTTEAASPATRLLMIRKVHGDILRRLSSPQSAAELLNTVEEIKAIAALSAGKE